VRPPPYADPRALVAAIVADADDADARLDSFYPEPHQGFRPQHATPVEVALLAAGWLAEVRGAEVLDVGAGAGRFCIVGALATEGRFVGIERRAHLVEAARRAAAALGAERARFEVGELDDDDALHEAFTGYYLFNPFAEHLLPREQRIDEEVPHEPARREADVARVERILARARPGTRVATWHGFGGALEGYETVARRYVRHGLLELLVRA
jgi:SAM-dependent methyltransferase